jgi:hypothetical protein|tara:strand:- start:3201 stop:3674 length:474 start_codon:yes stop_codon:yes gene_type:complete
MFKQKLVFENRDVEIYTPIISGDLFRRLDDRRIKQRIDLGAGLLIRADIENTTWRLEDFEAECVLDDIEERESKQRIGSYFFPFGVEQVIINKADWEYSSRYPELEQEKFLMRVDTFKSLYEDLKLLNLTKPDLSGMGVVLIGLDSKGISRVYDMGS